MTNRANFSKDTTADEALTGLDLTGKTVLITGGSSGLGAETARAMAAKGAQVTITARNLDKAAEVARAIHTDSGAEIAVEELELGSMDSIRAFAERFLAAHDRLNILINNAGVMACPESQTQDGLETQFGTNHIGHFLLTNLLAPALIKGAPARVVSLSSRGHRFSPVLFDDLTFAQSGYNKWIAYGQAKTANALFAVGLDARLKDHGVRAFSVHPGAIVTDLARHMTDEDWAMMRGREAKGDFEVKTVAAGAATSVWAATAPELDGMGGNYLSDCAVSEVTEDREALDFVQSYAVDPALADRLWTLSEKLVGQEFRY